MRGHIWEFRERQVSWCFPLSLQDLFSLTYLLCKVVGWQSHWSCDYAGGQTWSVRSNGCLGWFSQGETTGIQAARLMCAVAVGLPERTKRRCASPAMWHSSFALNLDGQQFMYNIPLMKSHAFFLCDLKNFFPLLLFKVWSAERQYQAIPFCLVLGFWAFSRAVCGRAEGGAFPREEGRKDQGLKIDSL